MKKRHVASFLLAGAFLVNGGFQVSASETGDNPNDVPDVPTEDQLKALEEKENAVKVMMKEKAKNSSAKDGSTINYLPDGYYKTLGVPSFEQITSYYCGPATVKQVLHYLNGASSSQGTYASQLGTTSDGTVFSLVDDVLNKNQSKNNYVVAKIGTYDSWSSKVQYALDRNYPAVLDLKIDPSYMPKYTRPIAGHILNVSGVDSKYTSPAQVRLTDPFDQDNRGVTLGNIWHPHKGVYNANNAHFRQEIIY